MNISNQLAVAIAEYLKGQTVSHSPTIIPGLTSDINEEHQSRIVVIGANAELRKPSLPGLYDVGGSVNVIQSVDDADGSTRFDAMCDDVESILGARSAVRNAIMAIDSGIFIYSYIWMGSALAANSRKFMATYNFTAFARNSNNTIT